MKNREDALWELENTIRNLEGGNPRWANESDLRQLENDVHIKEETIEDKEEKIINLQNDLNESQKKIGEM